MEQKFESFMMNYGYTRAASNQCLFIKKHSINDFIFLVTHVDDMLIVGYDARMNEDLKRVEQAFCHKRLRYNKTNNWHEDLP